MHAETLIRQNDKNAAITELQSFTTSQLLKKGRHENNALYFRALFELGLLRYQQNKFKRALSNFEKIHHGISTKKEQKNAYTLASLVMAAQCNAALGHAQQARNSLRAIISKKNESQTNFDYAKRSFSTETTFERKRTEALKYLLHMAQSFDIPGSVNLTKKIIGNSDSSQNNGNALAAGTKSKVDENYWLSLAKVLLSAYELHPATPNFDRPERESSTIFQQAQESFSQFVKSFPKSAFADDALYSNVLLNNKFSRYSNGFGHDEFLKHFPLSAYAHRSAYFTAESLFAHQDYNGASTFYEKALVSAEGGLAWRAQFRLGICYFRLEEFQRAMEKFGQFLVWDEKSKGISHDKYIKNYLVPIAESYLISSFMAVPDFKSIDSVLMNNRNVLFRDKLVVPWQERLRTKFTEAYFAMTLNASESFVEETALYQKYFPVDSQSAFIMWNAANIMENRLNRPKAAYEQYIELCGIEQDTNLIEQAAKHAIQIAEKSVKSGTSYFVHLLKSDKALASLQADWLHMPYSEWDKRFLRAIDNYVTIFQHNAKSGALLSSAGRFCSARQDYNRALGYFQQHLHYFPANAATQQSAELAIQCLLGMQKYDDAVALAKSHLNSENLQLRQYAERVVDDYHYFSLKNSNLSFEALCDPLENSEVCLFRQAVHFEVKDKYKSALEKYGQLVQLYPHSPYTLSSYWNMAKNYLLLGELSAAAMCFSKLADLETIQDHRKTYLLKALVLHKACDDFKTAIETIRDFVASFPDTEESEYLSFHVTALYDAQNQPEHADSALTKHVHHFPRSSYYFTHLFEQASSYRKQGHNHLAEITLEEVLQRSEGDSELRSIHSEATFSLTELAFERFQKTWQLVTKPLKMEQKKVFQNQLVDLVGRYSGIIKMNASRVRDAIYNTGSCYEYFADVWLTDAKNKAGENEQVAYLQENTAIATNIYSRAADSYFQLFNLAGKISKAAESTPPDQLSKEACSRAMQCYQKAAAGELVLAKAIWKDAAQRLDDNLTELEYKQQVLHKLMLPTISSALAYSDKAFQIADSYFSDSEAKNTILQQRWEIQDYQFQLIISQLKNISKMINGIWKKMHKSPAGKGFVLDRADEELSACIASIDGLLVESLFDDGLIDDHYIKRKNEFLLAAAGLIDLLHSGLKKSFSLQNKADMFNDEFILIREHLFVLQDVVLQTYFSAYKTLASSDEFVHEKRKIKKILLRRQPLRFAEKFQLSISQIEIGTDKTWFVKKDDASACFLYDSRLIVPSEQHPDVAEFMGTGAKKVNISPHDIEKPVPKSSTAKVFHFSNHFYFTGLPLRVTIKIMVNGPGTLRVNSHRIALHPTSGRTSMEMDITDYFKNGDNQICIHLTEENATAGLISLVQIFKLDSWKREGSH
ncbi:MAG: hypothetical protein DWQ10_04190 [Calditrichaeota bacterium]|nr:MAG: hypothetical protein DWQ10_04190 [Calditrichota bacterium]